jgi:S-adenosylmethionine hydrolase
VRPIALLTDFGLTDIYVGVMKGVMRGICPDVQFIDISHAITPQSVREGALALRNSYRYFPAGTIFLVVIDPGVGSKRRAVAVKAGGYAFVAPDNGILSYTLACLSNYQAVALENTRYRLSDVSATFHGRDVFAPIAAYLARGVDFESLGSAVTDLATLPQPMLEITGTQISGEIAHVDRFGNLITSIGLLRRPSEDALLLEISGNPPIKINADKAVIKIGRHTIYSIKRAYHEGDRGDLLAQADSNGYLEIAINMGSAAVRLEAAIGDAITLLIDGEHTS